jgi:hypothetical protein
VTWCRGVVCGVVHARVRGHTYVLVMHACMHERRHEWGGGDALAALSPVASGSVHLEQKTSRPYVCLHWLLCCFCLAPVVPPCREERGLHPQAWQNGVPLWRSSTTQLAIAHAKKQARYMYRPSSRADTFRSSRFNIQALVQACMAERRATHYGAAQLPHASN